MPPVRVLHATKDVLGVTWSPSQPLSFVMWGENGTVDFYDIRNNETKPTLSLISQEDKEAVTAICFNPKK